MQFPLLLVSSESVGRGRQPPLHSAAAAAVIIQGIVPTALLSIHGIVTFCKFCVCRINLVSPPCAGLDSLVAQGWAAVRWDQRKGFGASLPLNAFPRLAKAQQSENKARDPWGPFPLKVKVNPLFNLCQTKFIPRHPTEYRDKPPATMALYEVNLTFEDEATSNEFFDWYVEMLLYGLELFLALTMWCAQVKRRAHC